MTPARRLGGALLLAGACAAGNALAQQWQMLPSVTAFATGTDNSGLDLGSQGPKDVVLEVTPRAVLHGKGSHFTLEGDMQVRLLKYVRETQAHRVQPSGSIALNANLVERWVFLDTSMQVEQSLVEPFAAPSETNKVNSVRYRFSPYVEHAFTPAVSLTARSDNLWTHNSADLRDAYVQQNVLRLNRKPQPLGAGIEVSRQATRYAGAAESVLTLEAVRGMASYAFGPELVLGLQGGRERSEFSLTRKTEGVRGGRLEWRPGERTSLIGVAERRFFGTGWTVDGRHRSPFMALSFHLNREPVAQPASVLLAPTFGSLSSQLDALFRTRYPNPAERSAVVQNFISALGSPTQLPGPVEIFSDYAQLEQRANIALSLMGRRTVATFTLYWQKVLQLAQYNDAFSPLVNAGADSQQHGVAFSLNQRLTALTSLEIECNASRLEGLGVQDQAVTRGSGARVTLSHAVSPKSSVLLGGRRQTLDSNVVLPTRENAVFVGLIHRF